MIFYIGLAWRLEAQATVRQLEAGNSFRYRRGGPLCPPCPTMRAHTQVRPLREPDILPKMAVWSQATGETIFIVRGVRTSEICCFSRKSPTGETIFIICGARASEHSGFQSNDERAWPDPALLDGSLGATTASRGSR